MFGSRGEPMPGLSRFSDSVIGSLSVHDLLSSDPFPFTTSSLPCSDSTSQLQSQFHQGAGFVRCGVRTCGKGGHRDRASFSKVLQSPLCHSQSHRGLATSHRPLTPQRLGGPLQFSYEDCPVRSPVSPSGGLDGVPGSPGHLPPGSCTSGFSPVPEVLRGGCGVSIYDPVLRPVFRSSGVHPRHGSYFFHHASPRFSSSLLSRRLAGPGLHLSGPGACEGLPPLAMSSPQGHSQSFEELFGPDSDVGLSRDDSRDFSFEGFPDPQTGSEALSSSPAVFLRPSPTGVGLAQSSWDDVLHVCHRSGFSTPYAISSTSPQYSRAAPARRSSSLLGRYLPRIFGGGPMNPVFSSAFTWATTSQISVCSPTPQIKVGVQLWATSICPACGLPFARAFLSINASSWLFSLPFGVFCLTSGVRLWRFTPTILRLWLISGNKEAPIRHL